jgi:hypothetical protein
MTIDIEYHDLVITPSQIRLNNEPLEILQMVAYRDKLYFMFRTKKHIYSRHLDLDQKSLHLVLHWHGTFLLYKLPRAEKVMLSTATRQTLVHSDHSLMLKMQETAYQMIGLIQEYFPMKMEVYPQHCHTICPANQDVFQSILQVDHCTTLHLMLRDFYHFFHTQKSSFIIGLLSLNVLGSQFESILKGFDYPDSFLEKLVLVSFGIDSPEVHDGYVLKPLIFTALELRCSLLDLQANRVQMTPLVLQLLELTCQSFVSSDDKFKLYIQNDCIVELDHPNYSDRFDVTYEQQVCLSSY